MKYNLELIKNKKKIIGFSTVLILISLLGILYSTFNTSYKKPINLGMDFVGGNELRIERVCEAECSNVSPDSVLENLREISKILFKTFLFLEISLKFSITKSGENLEHAASQTLSILSSFPPIKSIPKFIGFL